PRKNSKRSRRPTTFFLTKRNARSLIALGITTTTLTLIRHLHQARRAEAEAGRRGSISQAFPGSRPAAGQPADPASATSFRTCSAAEGPVRPVHVPSLSRRG